MMTGPTPTPPVRSVIVDALRARKPCALTAELFTAYSADSRARERAHLQRIEAEAFRLGRAVGAYQMVLADAEARLERLCDVLDPHCEAVPRRLVPLYVGRAAARHAFNDGMDSGALERKAS